MGFFSKLFGKKKNDESKYLKTDAEMKKELQENEKKPISNEYVTEETEEFAVISEGTDEEAEKIEKEAEVCDVKEKNLVGCFEIKKAKDGRFVFNLYAKNKVIIATSQIYSSSQSAINGINSVIANAEKANIEDQTLKNPTVMPYPKWEIYKDKAEQFRFRLCAPNGSCVCHSQGYTTKASCKNGIESIIRTVKDAKIDKIYKKK